MVVKDIDYCIVSKPGLCRDINQDAVAAYVNQQIGVFVVADGMGGHSEGEKASALIIEKFDKWWDEEKTNKFSSDFMELIAGVRNSIESANAEIYSQFNDSQICGSTIVAILIYQNHYATFSVGDSRIYSKLNNKLKQLTVDDIWDNRQDIKQKFSQDEIRNHKNHGKLINAVGIRENVNISLSTDLLKKNQSFLLCTDGLYKYCDKTNLLVNMLVARNKKTIGKSSKRMIDRVYKNGAKDNVSFIIVSPKMDR